MLAILGTEPKLILLSQFRSLGLFVLLFSILDSVHTLLEEEMCLARLLTRVNGRQLGLAQLVASCCSVDIIAGNYAITASN